MTKYFTKQDGFVRLRKWSQNRLWYASSHQAMSFHLLGVALGGVPYDGWAQQWPWTSANNIYTSTLIEWSFISQHSVVNPPLVMAAKGLFCCAIFTFASHILVFFVVAAAKPEDHHYGNHKSTARGSTEGLMTKDTGIVAVYVAVVQDEG